MRQKLPNTRVIHQIQWLLLILLEVNKLSLTNMIHRAVLVFFFVELIIPLVAYTAFHRRE